MRPAGAMRAVSLILLGQCFAWLVGSLVSTGTHMAVNAATAQEFSDNVCSCGYNCGLVRGEPYIKKALIKDIKAILEKTDITELEYTKLESLNTQIANKIEIEKKDYTSKIHKELTDGECGRFNKAVIKRWETEKPKIEKLKQDKLEEDKLNETSTTQRATPARPLAALVSLIVMSHLSAQY